MSHHKSLIQLLRKTGLIFLLVLTIIMLLHILVTLYLCTSIPPWQDECISIFDSVLTVILYYVIPLIMLLCFYLLMNQLAKLEAAYFASKSRHRKRKSKSASAAHSSKTSHSYQTSHHSKSNSLQYESYTPHYTAHHSKR